MIDFSDLQIRYNKWADLYKEKKLPPEEGIKEAERLLADIIAAGEFIEDQCQRKSLSKAARNLGEAVFDLSNGMKYPSIRIGNPKVIEFVNRTNEIAFITNIYSPPYLLLTAPAGYGKTRLLENIKIRLQDQNSVCFYLLLMRDQQYTIQMLLEIIFRELQETRSINMTPKTAGFDFAKTLLATIHQNQRQFVFMLDGAEVLDQTAVKCFLNEFIPAVKNGLSVSPVQMRLICAGRYLASWTKKDIAIPIEVMSLTPFDFSAIYQIVEQYAMFSSIPTKLEYRLDFAAYLMYVTGGHLSAIIGILRQGFGAIIALLTEKEKESPYFEKFALPVLQEIHEYFSHEHFSEELVNCFKSLSVFRFYNLSLLQKIIINENLISYTGNVLDLERQLTANYLVTRKNGFLQDDIVRRLFVGKLFQDIGPEKFAELCQKAKEVYKEYLQETTYQVHFVVMELLYQNLQYEYYASDQAIEARKVLDESFFRENGILETSLKLLLGKKEFSYDILQNLKDILQRGIDWEFRFTLNFFLRKEHYTDEPYQRLLKEVENFINTHQQYER